MKFTKVVVVDMKKKMEAKLDKENRQILLVCLGFIGMIGACVCVGLLGNYMFEGRLLSCTFGLVGGGIVGYLWTIRMMKYLRNN